jgi:hypothetical protein
MPTALNIQEILSKVKKLDKEEQFTLLERIVALIRKEDTQNKPTKLSKISGIGSKVWQSTNIDEYIEQERQW